MSVGLLVEELAKVFGVYEVTVDAHGDTERRVDVERLSLGAVSLLVVRTSCLLQHIRRGGSHGRVANVTQAFVKLAFVSSVCRNVIPM